MANYSQLKAAIDAAIKTNGTQAITGQVLQDVLNSIVSVIGANYQFAGVAIPSTNPGTPDQNVFYVAMRGGTYTNFGATALPEGISLLMWNGSWTSEVIMYNDGGVFDISVYKSTGGTLATFVDLVAALDGGNNIPVNARKGGMSVKFVQTSDNKYVQYRFILSVFTPAQFVNISNWQLVDGRNYAMLVNKGFFLDYNHLMEENENRLNYKRNRNWDCAIIYIHGETRIKLNGLLSGASYRFYDSPDIFNGENMFEHYIMKNTDGYVPSGAVVCILNLSKSSYPNGYDSFYLTREYGEYINILLVGNSAAQDTVAYVPFILSNIGINKVRIGLLMQSDSEISWHVDNFTNESAVYTYYFFDSSDSPSWTNFGSSNKKTIQWALDNYKWDIIAFHQGANSETSGYNTTIQPYLNQIANLIGAYIDYDIKFIWFNNQSTPKNKSEETITLNFNKNIEQCQKIAKETIFEHIIPAGTAIQNARSITALKAMGDWANNPENTVAAGVGNLTYDGIHLQEGLPSQIAAYTFVLGLLDIYGLKQYSIIGETTRVTSEWSQDKNIPSPHGSPIGSTDENCLIAQKCAIMAVKKPFEVTDMNYIINPT